jgi:hydroxymethylbilane synthase
MQQIRIGSRGSDLALWQANHVKKQLEQLGQKVSITIIKTKGDVVQNMSFDKLEGKGFFTKEIEEALLNQTIDLAVHSHKDLETNPPLGLKIAAVSEREDPADVLLVRKESFDENQLWFLKKSAVVGTSSARRKALVKIHRPDLELKDLRGNVPGRIEKLRLKHYDAILLAKAGLDRLQIVLDEFIVVRLDPTSFVPAPAQGVLALQIRENDEALSAILSQLDHPNVRKSIDVERKLLNLMDGGCQLPLGAYQTPENDFWVAYSADWRLGGKVHCCTGMQPEEVVERLKKQG